MRILLMFLALIVGCLAVENKTKTSSITTTTTLATKKPSKITTTTLPVSTKFPGEARGKRTLYNLGTYPHLNPHQGVDRRIGGYPESRAYYQSDNEYPGSYYQVPNYISEPSNHLPSDSHHHPSIHPGYYGHQHFLEPPEPIIEIIIKESNETVSTPPPQPIIQKKKKEKVHVYYVNYKKDKNNKLHLETPIKSLEPHDTQNEEEEEEIIHYPIVTPQTPLKTTTLRTVIHPESEKFHSNSGIHVTFGTEDKSQEGHQLQEHNEESIVRSVIALPNQNNYIRTSPSKPPHNDLEQEQGQDQRRQENSQFHQRAFPEIPFPKFFSSNNNGQPRVINTGSHTEYQGPPPPPPAPQTHPIVIPPQLQATPEPHIHNPHPDEHLHQPLFQRPNGPDLPPAKHFVSQHLQLPVSHANQPFRDFVNQYQVTHTQQIHNQPNNQPSKPPFFPQFVQRPNTQQYNAHPSEQPLLQPRPKPQFPHPQQQQQQIQQQVQFNQRPLQSQHYQSQQQNSKPPPLPRPNFQLNPQQEIHQQAHPTFQHHFIHDSPRPVEPVGQHNKQVTTKLTTLPTKNNKFPPNNSFKLSKHQELPQYQAVRFRPDRPDLSRPINIPAGPSGAPQHLLQNPFKNDQQFQQKPSALQNFAFDFVQENRFGHDQSSRPTHITTKPTQIKQFSSAPPQHHAAQQQQAQQQHHLQQQQQHQQQQQQHQQQQYYHQQHQLVQTKPLQPPRTSNQHEHPPEVSQIQALFGSSQSELVSSVPKFEQHITEYINAPQGPPLQTAQSQHAAHHFNQQQQLLTQNQQINQHNHQHYNEFSFTNKNDVIHDIPAPNLGTSPNPYQREHTATSPAQQQYSGQYIFPSSTPQYENSSPQHHQQNYFVSSTTKYFPSSTPQYIQNNDGQQIQIVTPVPNVQVDYNGQSNQIQASGAQPQIIPNSEPRPQHSYTPTAPSHQNHNYNPTATTANSFNNHGLSQETLQNLEHSQHNQQNNYVSIQARNKYNEGSSSQNGGNSHSTTTKLTTTTLRPSTLNTAAKKNELQLPEEVPDDLRQQLLSSGILANADISVLDYDKVGDIALENLPPEHLEHFYSNGGGAQIAGSHNVLSVVKPNGDKVQFTEKELERIKETQTLPKRQNVDLKVVRFDSANQKSVTDKYIKSDSSVLPTMSIGDKQYNRYLPLKISGSQFPIPESDELKGKKISSVVVLAPVDPQQQQQQEEKLSQKGDREERDILDTKQIKFIAGDSLKQLLKKPTKENFKKWLEKESKTEIDLQSVVLLVTRNSNDEQEIYMYDIGTKVINRLNGELSTAFVNVAEENASSEDLENVQISDIGIVDMMEPTAAAASSSNNNSNKNLEDQSSSASEIHETVVKFSPVHENLEQSAQVERIRRKVDIKSGYSNIKN